MFGYCRIDVEELCIVESHPETVLDLRLDKPWSELEEFAASYDLNCEDSHYLTHIPFPVLLLRAMRTWKGLNHTFPPKRDQRSAFHQVIRNSIAVGGDEENVHEAIAHCHRLFAGTEIPIETKKLLADPILDNISEKVFFSLILDKFILDFSESAGYVC
jgi:amyloid beta precursor protein binding protein 1